MVVDICGKTWGVQRSPSARGIEKKKCQVCKQPNINPSNVPSRKIICLNHDSTLYFNCQTGYAEYICED